MIPELLAGMSALKSAGEIAKTIVDIKDQSKVVEIQTKIVEAQAMAISAQEKLSEKDQDLARLRKVIEAHDHWNIQSQRYRLKDFGSGTYAYELKEDDGEVPHLCCANCFSKRQISILQFKSTNVYQQRMMFCYSCSGQFDLGTPRQIDSRPNVRTGSSWST